MPKVSRTRVIDASAERIWDLVHDPHNLPRWWPRTKRVEDVNGSGARIRWTAVLETERGSGVRADFRSTASTENQRFAWEQVIAGTAFERILRASRTEIKIRDDGARSKVQLTSDESLKGMSRLGAQMVRGASRRRLDEALDGIELAVGER
jgi:uncharacterized protein YndB with AHSA1/START domain